MKSITFVIASLFVTAANADIIKCTFTEPFVSFEYSMTQSKMTINDAVTEKKTTVKNVSFQIKGAGQFELFDKNNKVIAKLYLDNNGSDGMSDTVYPYSAEWNGLFGGCTSNFQKATSVLP